MIALDHNSIKKKRTNENSDYVIVGETEEYDYTRIIEATFFIQEGARFIATNPNLTVLQILIL